MKKHLSMVILSIISVLSLGGAPREYNKSDNIRIVTYNIRRSGQEMSPANLWVNRKPLVFDMIRTLNPDVIGFQEVVKDQVVDLQTVLADYGSFGEPRSAKMTGWLQKWVMKHPKAKDEYNPIFYKRNKVTLLASGNFGINPTGRFKMFTAYLPRVCTWGHFEDNATGARFYVYNTHLDNSSSVIRRRQINQITKQVKKTTHDEPVVFMGDLNTPLKGKRKNKRLAKYGFVHAKNIAQQVVGPTETRTGWNNGELKVIDHIFIRARNPVVKKYEVVASPEGVFPSDHRPVVVDLNIE